MRPSRDRVKTALLVLALLGLTLGLGLRLAGRDSAAQFVWTAGVAPVLAALLVEIVVSLRRGDVGLDIVAALSMARALGCRRDAGRRRRRADVRGRPVPGELRRGPRPPRDDARCWPAFRARAMRYAATALEEVPLDAIVPGDRLLIRPGDVVPVDGAVGAGRRRCSTSRR